MRTVLKTLALMMFVSLAYAESNPVKGQGAGEILYEQKCGSCHEPREPKTLTQKVIKSQLEKMAPMANISDKDKKLILKYLLPKAKDATK